MKANAKINLDFAARVIHGIGLPEAIMKTRIRRLYDIANILQSLKLIKKVTITEAHGGRKPAFTYTGPDLTGIGKNTNMNKLANPMNHCVMGTKCLQYVLSINLTKP